MTDKPILFSAPMIEALLDGRKTQTRRVLKPQPEPRCSIAINDTIASDGMCRFAWETARDPISYAQNDREIPIRPGDRLWVKEAHYAYGWWETTDELKKSGKHIRQFVRDHGMGSALFYEDEKIKSSKLEKSFGLYKRPSIFMHKADSRITLTVTDVRVERLQDISRGDAMGEGCPFPNMAKGPDPVNWFKNIWGDINGPNAWDENPWVVAYIFEVHQCNIDRIPQ